MHRVKENAFQMKHCLLRADFNGFAKVLGASWESKKSMANGISNSLIDEAYLVATEAGAISGKVSGAGGGGFMMFCVEPTKKLSVMTALRACGGETMHVKFTDAGVETWKA